VQQLISLIRSGKLFALQDWIKAGKRIRSGEICDDRAHNPSAHGLKICIFI
jgi:hypothetical protein